MPKRLAIFTFSLLFVLLLVMSSIPIFKIPTVVIEEQTICRSEPNEVVSQEQVTEEHKIVKAIIDKYDMLIGWKTFAFQYLDLREESLREKKDINIQVAFSVKPAYFKNDYVNLTVEEPERYDNAVYSGVPFAILDSYSFQVFKNFGSLGAVANPIYSSTSSKGTISIELELDEYYLVFDNHRGACDRYCDLSVLLSYTNTEVKTEERSIVEYKDVCEVVKVPTTTMERKSLFQLLFSSL